MCIFFLLSFVGLELSRVNVMHLPSAFPPNLTRCAVGAKGLRSLFYRRSSSQYKFRLRILMDSTIRAIRAIFGD